MTSPGVLRGSSRALCLEHDVALLDLDGVIYVGAGAVPHAVEAVREAARQGMRWAPVTNNALRAPGVVAAHLTELGLPTTAEEVVTSAQAAARVLSERLPPRARVLVCGGEGLVLALEALGLTPVPADSGVAEHVDAVVTGFDPEMTYTRLAEASLALRRGVPWVASNSDASVPTPRGLQPGAGATVAFLSTGSGRAPDETAGKPHPAMHRECLIRTGASSPIIVGDRLDTDIAGAVAVGATSLAVLTGVIGPAELLAAPADARPDHIARDLRGLLEPQPAAEAADGGWVVRGSRARVTDGVLAVDLGDTGDAVDALRAACAAVWTAGTTVDVDGATQRLRSAIAAG